MRGEVLVRPKKIRSPPSSSSSSTTVSRSSRYRLILSRQIWFYLFSKFRGNWLLLSVRAFWALNSRWKMFSRLSSSQLNWPWKNQTHCLNSFYIRLTLTFLQTVHKSLSGLTKVIRGTALVDEKVSRLADNLMKQQTPAAWQKMWEGPEEPVQYITTIVTRYNLSIQSHFKAWIYFTKSFQGSLGQGRIIICFSSPLCIFPPFPCLQYWTNNTQWLS